MSPESRSIKLKYLAWFLHLLWFAIISRLFEAMLSQVFSDWEEKKYFFPRTLRSLRWFSKSHWVTMRQVMQPYLIKKGKTFSYLIFGAVLGQIGLLLKYSRKDRQGFHSFAEIYVDREQRNYLCRHWHSSKSHFSQLQKCMNWKHCVYYKTSIQKVKI